MGPRLAMAEPELHYYCAPDGDQPAEAPGAVLPRPVDSPVESLPAQDSLADEPACKALWDLIGTGFRTRSKFLTVWPGVRYVALHRGPIGSVDGLLLVTAPINWQIDYVVVRPEARG